MHRFRVTCGSRSYDCLCFELESAEYSLHSCKLSSPHANQEQITVRIKGKRLKGSGTIHDCELKVQEQGNQSRAEFATNPNAAFGNEARIQPLSCDTSLPATYVIYVRKVASPPAGSVQVMVECSFRHCIQNITPWCDHKTTLTLQI